VSKIEKPMLFSGSMVRALLADLKTQTRRIAKLNCSGRVLGKVGKRKANWHPDDPDAILAAPHPVGSRVWVKETHVFGEDDRGYYVLFTATNTRDYSGQEFMLGNEFDEEHNGFKQTLKKPSIHMPRWASRITLEITNVRLERLNEISEEDAKAEGVTILPSAHIAAKVAGDTPARMEYWHLWESINGKGSWEKNPLVFAYDFKRIKP